MSIDILKKITRALIIILVLNFYVSVLRRLTTDPSFIMCIRYKLQFIARNDKPHFMDFICQLYMLYSFISTLYVCMLYACTITMWYLSHYISNKLNKL